MLDDPALRARVDPSEFWRLIAELPLHARAARELGERWQPLEGFVRPSRVVVLGVGGSAIGGDVVATLASRLGSVPVEVVRDYSAPPPDEGTLLVASSFSGNTEEVLTAFSEQHGGPGQRLAITTGGRLAALTREHDVPLLTYKFDGPPRSAFGYGVLLLLQVLQRLGVLDLDPAAIESAVLGLGRGARGVGTGPADGVEPREADRVAAAGSGGAGRGGRRAGRGGAPLGGAAGGELEAVGVRAGAP